MKNNKTDEQIMFDVKEGDLDALATLFEKYHIRLYNFFLRMTRNKTISEDLTQNVFQRILTYRDSYDKNWKFYSWMYQIARNAAYKHYNEQKLLISDKEINDNISYVSTNAFDEIDIENKKEQLYDALNKLSFEQREIIEMARFQELKYKEIAEITGNTVPAIKVKVHRAINKLREVFFETA